MRRRGFLKWLGAVAASVALDPLLGDQSVWGTAQPAVKPPAAVQANALRSAANFRVQGGSFLESGYVHAPYIPLQITPTFLEDHNPKDYEYKIHSRYVHKKGQWYGQITVEEIECRDRS